MSYIIEAKNNKAPISKLATRAAGAVLMAGMAAGCGGSHHESTEVQRSAQGIASSPSKLPSAITATGSAAEGGETVKLDLCSAIPESVMADVLDKAAASADEASVNPQCRTDNPETDQLTVIGSIYGPFDIAHFYAGEHGGASLAVSVIPESPVSGNYLDEVKQQGTAQELTVEGYPAVNVPNVGILYVNAHDDIIIAGITPGDSALQLQLDTELAEAVLQYGFTG